MAKLRISLPLLVFLLLLSLSANDHHSTAAEARTLPFSSTSTDHLRSSNIFATLGVVCKCCDGENGECRSSWEGSCSDVQCLPWRTGKQHPLGKAG